MLTSNNELQINALMRRAHLRIHPVRTDVLISETRKHAVGVMFTGDGMRCTVFDYSESIDSISSAPALRGATPEETVAFCRVGIGHFTDLCEQPIISDLEARVFLCAMFSCGVEFHLDDDAVESIGHLLSEPTCALINDRVAEVFAAFRGDPHEYMVAISNRPISMPISLTGGVPMFQPARAE